MFTVGDNDISFILILHKGVNIYITNKHVWMC